jgi:hypothetical protein
VLSRVDEGVASTVGLPEAASDLGMFALHLFPLPSPKPFKLLLELAIFFFQFFNAALFGKDRGSLVASVLPVG